MDMEFIAGSTGIFCRRKILAITIKYTVLNHDICYNTWQTNINNILFICFIIPRQRRHDYASFWYFFYSNRSSCGVFRKITLSHLTNDDGVCKAALGLAQVCQILSQEYDWTMHKRFGATIVSSMHLYKQMKLYIIHTT